MSYSDRELECVDCGQTFTFSASEQEFYASKGYTNDPKRCPACRNARKARRAGDAQFQNANREMFPAVCAECGKDTQVPFQPHEDRPVYCSDCYNTVRLSRSR